MALSLGPRKFGRGWFLRRSDDERKVHVTYCSSAKVGELRILSHKAGRAPQPGVHGAMPPWIETKKKGPGVYFMPKYGPNRHFQLKVVSWLVSMCVGGGACSARNDAL